MKPIELITQWIEDGKPLWWKHAIRLALRHGELGQLHLDEVYKFARMEHQLDMATTDFMFSNDLIDISGYVSELTRVNLYSLSNVAGVGVLAEGQELRFPNKGLNIVYGDNGAGKSSYASILKHACLTRGACPPILGNVFQRHNPIPTAQLTVITADTAKTIFAWNANLATEPLLKSIRVFDTASAHHYVNKEDSIGFKPAGLNLLSELSKAISYVKALVEEDTTPGNGLINLTTLPFDNPASNFANHLSFKTDEAQVELHKATPEELSRIDSLAKEIAQYKLQTPETIKAQLQQKYDLLNPLYSHAVNTIKFLGDKACSRLVDLRLDHLSKQKQAEELKNATLQGLPFETVAGLNWQQLWSAAKVFIQQEPATSSFPPQQGDSCPLCLQEITEQSGKKLSALNAFLMENASTQAADARQIYTSALKKVQEQDPRLENYKAALTELKNLKPGLDKKVIDIFEELAQRKANLKESEISFKPTHTVDLSVVEEFKHLLEELRAEYEGVNTKTDLNDLIRAKEADLQHILARKYVLENVDSIVSNIQRHKVIFKINAIKNQCNTKPISTISSQINQSNIIEPLEVAFNEELKRFGFERFKVVVQTRNSAGNQQFKLAIAEAGEPVVAKVASEGEQRCIAIAAFLAEMRADNRQSAVIFDDPVNSLSHQWSSKVANRLVAESLSRQVIVLTHDIVFYKLLLEAAELQSASSDSIALERSRTNVAGIVRDSAPWEALTTSKRIKALNSELQSLRSIDKLGTDDEFRKASRHFYGLLRESWERLVEEKLLNKVVTRFERGIYTQRLSKLTDITLVDIERVDAAMSKCSAYFTGHDSATAMGDPYPTIQEIADDLENIDSFLAELQTLRKRS